MLKKILPGALLVVLLSAPALARDAFDVDYGRHENRYAQPKQRRGGAWIGNNRGHVGAPHGGRWGVGHDHFSPRGQGGHHWGW